MIVALLSSFLVVALAEMGDKTQLAALSMASRYRRPWAVRLGIRIATTVNHALASSVGGWTATCIPAAVLQRVLALGFIGFGVWTLVPDSSVELARLPAPEDSSSPRRWCSSSRKWATRRELPRDETVDGLDTLRRSHAVLRVRSHDHLQASAVGQ